MAYSNLKLSLFIFIIGSSQKSKTIDNLERLRLLQLIVI